MPQSQNGLSAEAEEVGGANGSDDESSNGGMKGSPRWSKVSSGTKGWRLRGVEWRVKLGVLPGGPASVDAMRRATADGRRRYADLRRRLLVDPHIVNGDDEEDTSMDNPLSLDPESVWGRYFRNAELEKTIDKDLTRLYPEHGVFFQSTPCQKMMRRILLVWSLIHPQFSYRQGMHELLAPLLYVLHVDVVRLSQVKHRFEDLFDDRFDSLSLQEEHVRDKVESAKKFVGEMIIVGDSINFDDKGRKNVDPAVDSDEERVDLSVIVQGSDMYGVEGELGALLSARFLEHDAYCMLDAMLIGQGGAVSMAAYFSSPPGVNVPPVIEASASLYRTLAAADISLYTHLVELGVEPQFFALRWLRLLFGREFILEDLLRVWDAILAADNTPLFELDGDDESCILRFSQRSALISSMAVSMLLYVRPALLAAPDATACLQRLLNFPQVPDVRNLIETAKSLQLLAQAAERAPNPSLSRSSRASEMNRNGKHARSGSISPPTTTHHALRNQKSASCSPDVMRSSMSLPGSYWEEKWTHSVLQKKSPEQLFSPRASKLDEVVKNHENVDRDTSGMLSRSVSEGRHQISRSNAVVAQSASVLPDLSQDSSDEEGREMQGRSEKAADKASRSRASSAESVASTSDCDGSRDSDCEGQKLLNHHRSSTDGEGSVTSSKRILKLSCADARVDDDVPSPQEKKIITCDSSGGCDMPEERKNSDAAEPCQGRVAPESQVPSAGSGCTLVSDLKPSNLFSSTPNDLESEADRMGSENGSVCLPVSSSNSSLLDESKKEKPHCVADSHVRVEIVSSASCEYPEAKLKLQDGESTCSSPPPLPSSANEGEGGDQSVVEDISRNVDSSPLPSKPKAEAPAALPARLGRLHWMWSLGKTSFGERTPPNKVETPVSLVVPPTSGNPSDTEGLGSPLASGVRKPKRWWRSNNDVVPEECVATSSSDAGFGVEPSTVPLQVDNVKNTNESVIIGSGVLQKEDVSVETQVNSQEAVKKPKDKSPSAALQALGQAMLEHVQVLESSLAQKASILGMETMMWTPAVREKSESTRSTLGGKSQAAALAAIAELRKISHALQQM